MRWIYFSPHLDDAILSCGGLIWEQTRAGTRVEVWTIWAGDLPNGPLSPFAEKLHATWQTGTEAPARRRDEDVKACHIVGARHRHLSFPDCIYRRGMNGEWLYPNEEAIIGELHPADRPLVETLHDLLVALIRVEDTLVCPLSIGGHVDHRLTRSAVEFLRMPLHYYADVPYVLKEPSSEATLTSRMQARVLKVSTSGLEAWQAGVAAYGSQISSFWSSLDEMRQAIQNYGRGGIRIWSVGQTTAS